ncbi:hypothetical protein AGMMS49959_07470 [Planctomycetales bacterium]|nr:hypothetical protein AGMMS49959_07470 [Planctomycetales bacterium]
MTATMTATTGSRTAERQRLANEMRGDNAGVFIAPRRESSLLEMLNRITEQNLHKKIETGAPVGNEIW